MGKIFLGIIPVATFGLGVWQVKRWRWKLKLIEEMEQKVLEEPVDFPSNDFSKLPELEYRKVRMPGKFNYSKQLIMGPRSLIATKEPPNPKSTPSTGYHVVTPFWVTDQSLAILVNRGWIPSRNYKPYSTETDPKEVEIIAVLRSTEKRLPFMGQNIRGENGLWLFRDISAMGDYLQTSDVFVDLVSIRPLNSKQVDQNALTPIPGQTRVTLKNDHVTYFCTWFTLSILTGIMWRRLYITKRPLR